MWSPAQRRNAGPIAALLFLAALGGIASADESVTKSADESAPNPPQAWFGVTVDRIDDAWREQQGYTGKGVRVTDVAQGGPADRVGVARGDVIVSLGSHTLKSPDQIAELEQTLEPGAPVSLVIARDGGRMIRILNIHPDRPPGAEQAEASKEDLGAVLVSPWAASSDDADASGDAKESAKASTDDEVSPAVGAVPVPPAAPAVDGGRLGARCQNMNRDLAAALGAPGGSGVLVVEVVPDGPADAAGIRSGDIITHVGDARVSKAENLERLLDMSQGVVAVHTLHRGTRKIAQVTLADAKTDASGEDAPGVAATQSGETSDDAAETKTDSDHDAALGVAAGAAAGAAAADGKAGESAGENVDKADADKVDADKVDADKSDKTDTEKATDEKATAETAIDPQAAGATGPTPSGAGVVILGGAAALDAKSTTTPEPTMMEMREEIHRLRVEVKRLRAEVEAMKNL